MKKISVDTADKREQLVSELKTLLESSATNLVQLYDAFFDGEDVYLALEYMDVGTLKELIVSKGPMPEHVVGPLAKQMLDGLQFLAEKQSRIHRDFKPDNVQHTCSTHTIYTQRAISTHNMHANSCSIHATYMQHTSNIHATHE